MGIIKAFIKSCSIDSRNKQSPTCEVVLWNKRILTSDISNRFLASSVSRAQDWWSGGCEFKPCLGQFLTKFILCCVTLNLSDNLTEMRLKGLTWKTQLKLLHWAWNNQPQIVATFFFSFQSLKYQQVAHLKTLFFVVITVPVGQEQMPCRYAITMVRRQTVWDLA